MPTPACFLQRKNRPACPAATTILSFIEIVRRTLSPGKRTE